MTAHKYDSMPPFRILLAEANDLDLVLSTYCKIADKYNVYVDKRIGVTATESISGGIGVRLIGHNAENMLRIIRPFFQLHFPHGSFVTRSRNWPPNEDRNAPELRWTQPQPLFEGDEITPPWWLSVYMD